jgi:hypothetical protein
MKTISLTILLLMASVVAVLGADTPATPVLKKNEVIFKYSHPPPLTERPLGKAEMAPLPRVGSKEWLLRVGQRDRDLLSSWELWQLNAWHAACSFIEPSPSATGLNGAWR